MRHSSTQFLLMALTCLWILVASLPATSAGTRHAQSTRLAAPFTVEGADGWTEVPKLPDGEPRSPDGAYAYRDFPSPDGKYVARMSAGDAEITWLRVFRVAGGSQPFPGRRRAVSGELDGARTGIWVPGHAHWLVAACWGCSDYDLKGAIVLWTGSRFRHLRWPLDPDKQDMFSIVGVTRDGKTLVYTHSNYPGERPGSENTWRTLRLPRR
ncbi:MAG: hypothetical protein ACLQVD_01205 [Capsulimonadaceae bacterium]